MVVKPLSKFYVFRVFIETYKNGLRHILALSLQLIQLNLEMSHRMEKPTICIGENKAADQPCSNCTADQRLCFRSIDSTIPLLLKSEISRFWPAPETVQASLCRTWSETQIVGFLMHRLKYRPDTRRKSRKYKTLHEFKQHK